MWKKSLQSTQVKRAPKITLMNLLLEVESIDSCRFQIHVCILACVMSREFTRESVTKFLPLSFPEFDVNVFYKI